jgi:SAM-dependent methyltransferase
VNSLDLYATIEPLIGFDEQYKRLYTRYLKELTPLHVTRILDIGCGNGKLLQLLEKEGFEAQGIERSRTMVERARDLGVNASLDELDSFKDGSFDAILAVADVLNYIPPRELSLFFEEIARVLKPNGFFLADINTLHGFENVADGVMVKEIEGNFLSVDASFENPLLKTIITLFTPKDQQYTKEQGEIMQVHHPLSQFKKIPLLPFVKSYPIHLFSHDVADKTLFILKRFE